jgi:hypothetical protein
MCSLSKVKVIPKCYACGKKPYKKIRATQGQGVVEFWQCRQHYNEFVKREKLMPSMSYMVVR